MSSNPPPRGGLVVMHENVQVNIENGIVTVSIALHDGSSKVFTIDQNSGEQSTTVIQPGTIPGN